MVDFGKYENEYKKHYKQDFSIEELLIKERQKIVKKTIQNFTHKSVLEIGCGKNPFFKVITNYKKYHIVEPVNSFIKEAKELVKNDNRFEFFNCTIEDSNFLEKIMKNRYDFIIVSSLLHEVSDPVLLLSVIKRIADKSTVIHFNVPNVFSFHRLLAVKADVINDIFEKSDTEKRFQRNNRYDIKGFKELLTKSGFDILETGTYFLKPFTSSQLEKMLAKGIVENSVIEALGKMIEFIPDMGCEMYANVRTSG
jgi:SAM-dependent methyltransferase